VGDLLKAVEACSTYPGSLANILSTGFNNIREGFEIIQDAVGVAADIETERLMQKVYYLNVLANVTPMLGLLGTVQGMIYAFGTLANMPPGSAQQTMLANNISHGLWATAVGLGIALPSLTVFTVLKNKATSIVLTMEALTLDMIKGLKNVEVVEDA
jgi:biopolymer transport protein ExbB